MYTDARLVIADQPSTSKLDVVTVVPSNLSAEPSLIDKSSQHIVLVRPAGVSSKGTWNIPFTPPIGLAYLAGMIREDGFRVSIVDSMGEAPKQFLTEGNYIYQGLTIDECVDLIAPDATVIGVTCMFTQEWLYARALIRAIRRRFPHVLLIAGGEHITGCTDYSLRDCPELDLCVRGEGEETLREIARCLGDIERARKLPGVAWIDRDLPDQPYRQAPPRARIRAIDDLPWPAWDLVPVETFVTSDNAYGVNRGRTLAALATRGCPYKCTFCSNPLMYGNLWQARNPEKLIEEIEEFIRRYQIQNFDFYDLTMVLKKEWILDFCRLVRERNLKITWQLPAGTRSEVIDDEIAAALYESGARNITYAPESGSVETLAKIKKRVNLTRLLVSIKSAVRNKLRVKCSLIIGFPHENRTSVFQTMLFAWKSAWVGVDAVECMVFTPYPGSELFDELRAEGRVPELNDDYIRSMAAFLDPFVPSHYCKHISGYELMAWRWAIMLSFFAVSFTIRPWRFARLVMSLFNRNPETVVENRLSAMLRRPKAKQAQVVEVAEPVS
ncbi:B12-binding domain-containing radical SAM protein [bacterium]|nr:B12-binding domain-containing radical SAM protein [bacterium]